MRTIETYDTGSVPFEGDWERFLVGAKPVDQLLELLYPLRFEGEQSYFDEKVVENFLQKIQAGIDVPNYPQFRDMNQMFFDVFKGIEKTPNGYVEMSRVEVKPESAEISEIASIRRHAKEITEKTGSPLRIKVCVTGPYTLATALVRRRVETFVDLAEAISKVVSASVFDGKYCGVKLLLVEEPSFGILDDPFLDFGQEGREVLLHAWEHIFEAVKIKGVFRGFHLHSTRDELFWNVVPVEIVESHVDDPLYASSQTKDWLEKTDKFIKASIAVTDFDALIRRRLTRGMTNLDDSTLNEKVGEAWRNIRDGSVDPLGFIEDAEQIQRRLRSIVSGFGSERVRYAGPECGLRSFPTPLSAMELLRRVSETARSF